MLTYDWEYHSLIDHLDSDSIATMFIRDALPEEFVHSMSEFFSHPKLWRKTTSAGLGLKLSEPSEGFTNFKKQTPMVVVHAIVIAFRQSASSDFIKPNNGSTHTLYH